MYRIVILILVFLIKLHTISCQDVILLFGPPGSGKGTFAQFAKTKGYGHVSAGDLIRHEISRNTPLSPILEKTLQEGNFIDSDIMFQLLVNHTKEFIAKKQPFIIDGYGKTTQDIETLKAYLDQINANIQIVFLDAPDSVCKARVQTRLVCPSCDSILNRSIGYNEGDLCPHCKSSPLQKRANDTEEVTNKRLDYYRSATQERYAPLCATTPHFTYSTNMDLDSCIHNYKILLNKLIPSDP